MLHYRQFGTKCEFLHYIKGTSKLFVLQLKAKLSKNVNICTNLERERNYRND